MWCTKCNHDLSECECSDLPERVKALRDKIIFSPGVLRRAREVEGMRELKNVGKKNPES